MARTRLRLGVSTALVCVLGGLVGIAVLVVLGLGWWSGHQSGQQIKLRMARQVVDRIITDSRRDFDQAADRLAILAGRIAEGDYSLDRRRLGDLLGGALATMPEASALIFIDTDRNLLTVSRRLDGIEPTQRDGRHDPSVATSLERARQSRQAHWGEPIWRGPKLRTALELHQPVRRGERLQGLLLARISLASLSRQVAENGGELAATGFVLYGRDHVLAHALMQRPLAGLSEENPLPRVAALDDAVLKTIWEKEELGADDSLIRTAVIGGKAHFFHTRKHAGFGERPRIVGLHFPAAGIAGSFRHYLPAAIAGLAVFALALLLGRHIAQPLGVLAEASRRVRELRLAETERLPPSRLSELDDAARSFNAMLVGLSWFESFVSKDLMHRLLRQGHEGLAAEQREVSVMFTDIAGFTAISENLTPNETAALLNRHFDAVTACVLAEGGSVDKFTGDGVMAFWGAPEGHTDHAERACRAALAIAEIVRLAGYDDDPPLTVRIGLHSGPAVVGNIGSSDRVNYTVIGDTVNIGQRVEELGREMLLDDEQVVILVSAGSVNHLSPELRDRLSPLGEHRLRGRSEALEVFRLG